MGDDKLIQNYQIIVTFFFVFFFCYCFCFEKSCYILALFSDKSLFVMHFIGDILFSRFSCKLG